ncbi:hypothetical protein AAVH_08452 [Aphelenchoides avenae]|nr:hypothetical protein AAVH_08452 [Aphelenchus avenae]
MGPTFAYIAQCLLDFDAPCTSYVSSIMSMITLVNPITTMFFVRSYRNVILRNVFANKNVTSKIYSITKSPASFLRTTSRVDSSCDVQDSTQRSIVS